MAQAREIYFLIVWKIPRSKFLELSWEALFLHCIKISVEVSYKDTNPVLLGLHQDGLIEPSVLPYRNYHQV
jgi:hypothetical protein